MDRSRGRNGANLDCWTHFYFSITQTYVKGHPQFNFQHPSNWIYKALKKDSEGYAHSYKCFHIFCPIKPPFRFKLGGPLVGIKQVLVRTVNEQSAYFQFISTENRPNSNNFNNS